MKKINRELENKIIEENKGLIFKVVNKYRYREDFEDIVQEAFIGLLIAYRRFDIKICDGYNNWAPFAVKCIFQRINNLIFTYPNRKKRYTKEKISSLNITIITDDGNNLEFIETIEDLNVDIEEEILNKIELDTCLDKLKRIKYKKILQLRYDGYSLRDIGKIIGLSGERVRQILLIIKKYLEKNQLI